MPVCGDVVNDKDVHTE